MDRATVGLSIFGAAACGAMVFMIAKGGPKHPRPVPAPAAQVAEPERGEASRAPVVTPAGAPMGMSRARPRGPDLDEPAPPMGVPTNYRAVNSQNWMKMRLRELAMGEEQYYQQSNKYTTDISQLMLMKRTGDLVVLKVTSAGLAGWSAEATHPAAPGKSCVTYTGPANQLPSIPTTLVDHTQPLGERDVVCDRM